MFCRNNRLVNIVGFIVIYCIFICASYELNTLVYFVNYELKPDKDFAKVYLETKIKDKTLSSAVKKQNQLMKKIQQITQEYCVKYKLKNNCNIKIKAYEEQIQPLYVLKRQIMNKNAKQILFSSFQMRERIRLDIKNVNKIGNLIEDLLKISPELTMNEFIFKKQDYQQAQKESLKGGIEQGMKLCKQLNGDLYTILNIQQVLEFEVVEEYDDEKDYQDDEQQDDGQQQQQQRDQNESIKWKFVISCKTRSQQNKYKLKSSQIQLN